MENMLVKNNLVPHTFLGHVYCKPKNDSLDLDLLVREFGLDVRIDETKTMILQGSHIVDKPFEICSTRYKNKKINYDSYGFTKKSFPRSPEIMSYSYPPELIPIGCYCKECNKQGPYLHSEVCPKPKKVSLYLTFDGFVNSIFIKKELVELDEDNSDLFIEFYEKLKKFIKFVESNVSKKNFENYKNIIKEHSEEYSEFFSGSLTNIPITIVSSTTKKDTAKFFSGPVMIKYKRSDGDVTIRIRSDATIELISNPWSNRDLYLEIIKRINKTSQKVSFKNIEIRSFFSSINLFGSNKQFDMKKVFNYFWPMDKNGFPISVFPKEEIITNSKTIYYIRGPKEKGQEKIYNYFIHKDKYSKNRLYMELISMSIDKSIIKIGPYKINIQLFAQGHLQITFGYYNSAEGLENMDDQFIIIKNIFEDIQNLFLYHLSKMISDDNTSVCDTLQKQPSKKIYETIGGSIPYAKKKKFKIGDQVQEFSSSRMKWKSKLGTIIKINDQTYTIEFKKKDEKIIKKLDHSMIRNMEENNDQVCRLKENGVLKQPIPYSFLQGQCPGGLNQIIKPIGAVSRTDNRQYPFCSEIKKGDEEWLVDFLINGLTKEERVQGFIKKGSSDNFCGVFIPGTAAIGSNVIANIGSWKNVQILEKYKTHGLGNDKIVVKYKVVTLDDKREEFEITGEDFHKSHVENRNYEGLPKGREKEILISAAKKLHLIKTIFSLENEKPLKNKVKTDLTLFSSKDIDHVRKNKYFCCVIPETVYNKCRISIKNECFKFINEDSSMYVKEHVDDLEPMKIFGLLSERKFYIYDISTDTPDKLRYHKFLNKFSIIENILKKMNIELQPLTCINLDESLESFLSQKVIIDNIYGQLKNTIVFIPRNTIDKTFIYSVKKIRTVDVKLVSCVNNLWTCGIDDPEFKKFFEENKIKFSGNKGDYISIKPNIMMDGFLNPNNPILNIKASSKDNYNPNVSMILRHILYPVSPSMLVKLNN